MIWMKQKKSEAKHTDFLRYEDIFSIEDRCEKLAKEILEREKVKK